MSILNHRNWNKIAPYFYKEQDANSLKSKPRWRIEVKTPPPRLKASALRMTMPCVACGETIHPVRQRTKGGNARGGSEHMYYAPTCPLDVNVGCSRGKAARDEYANIAAAL